MGWGAGESGHRRRRVGAAATALGAAALLAGRPAPALEIDGRYVGSYIRSETSAGSEEAMQHRYDVGTRTTTPGGLDLDLRSSLQYRNRLEPQSGLLRTRFFGDLSTQLWRLHGQLVPWQAVAPGDDAPHERDLQLGLDLRPRRLPQLELFFNRRDRSVADLPSWTEDQRATLTYGIGNFGANLGFRRIDAAAPGSLSAPTVTKEWRGGLRGSGSWKTLAASADYDALLSDSTLRERRRDSSSHRVNTDATWMVTRRFSLGGAWLERWGLNRDNSTGPVVETDIDERTIDARAGYRPLEGLDLELLREYRRRMDAAGPVVSDYLRGQGTYRRPVVRGLTLNTGYARSQQLRTHQGELPNDTAFGLLDGHLRNGIEGRAELRAGRGAGGTDSTGTQWHRLLQLRTFPSRTTRLDITWSRDTLPRVSGATQRDRQWELTASYQPVSALSLVGSWRRLDGAGRVERRESYTSFTSSWQTRRRVTLGTNWSRRVAAGLGPSSRETVTGIDLGFWLPDDYRTQTSWRYVSGEDRLVNRSYNLTLTKNF